MYNKLLLQTQYLNRYTNRDIDLYVDNVQINHVVMNNLDVEEAIGYVNKIIDNVRCATCDRLQGSRLRYSCGHIACEDCVTYAAQCQICTSPSQRYELEPKPDLPLTRAVKNAADLLNASLNLFDVNAFQHKKISEQLRIEKELFPKCIQAPVKYENKRKSTHLPSINKENRFSNFFPGEATSTPESNKMANSRNYVQQWLTKNEKDLARKPFADLNVNTQQIMSSKTKLTKQSIVDENVPLAANRKRSHFKTTNRDYSRLGANKKSVSEYKSPAKKVKKERNVSFLEKKSSVVENCDNDESGIFMDNELIVIDDSQESVIDKDQNAWLAVLKACENEDLTSTSLVNSSQVNPVNNSCNQVINSEAIEIKDTIARVPFIKRSAIIETCRQCKNEVTTVKSELNTSPTKPVKITIDNDNFVTTITVFKNVQKDVIHSSNSVFVQTDTDNTKLVDSDNCLKNGNNENERIFNEIEKPESESCIDKESVDLFADDKKIFGVVNQKPEIVIAESDSDSDLDASGPMSVKADVHRSCQDNEYGILAEVINVKEHENKSRRGPRGHTPTSTDSSEKENYNPNRVKKNIAGKKKNMKK